MAGERTIVLIARARAYNGGVVGTATVTREIGPQGSAMIVDFGQVRVPPKATPVFSQATVAGDPGVTYDRGDGPCEGVTQTLDTVPPPSEDIRDAVGLVVTGSPAGEGVATTSSCPRDPAGTGESTTRGFYVTDYGGVRIDTVSHFHRVTQKGTRRIWLTARLGTYDGPILATHSVHRDIDKESSESIFDLDRVAVPAGATIAFTQQLLIGENDVMHDIGFGPCLHGSPAVSPRAASSGSSSTTTRCSTTIS